jgi:hypothetical protein
MVSEPTSFPFLEAALAFCFAVLDMSHIDLQAYSKMSQMWQIKLVMATLNGSMTWEILNCFPSEAKYIYWPEFCNLIQQRKRPSLASIL